MGSPRTLAALGLTTVGLFALGGAECASLASAATLARRPAFEVTPIVEGSRYEIRMARGASVPVPVDHSYGLVPRVESIEGRTELVIRREGPALVPGGMVRLVERLSGETRVVRLPISPESGVGWADEAQGAMLTGAGDLYVISSTSFVDPYDCDVVLDPPGAYELDGRTIGREGSALLSLRSLTREPVDVTIGFRLHGRWVEIQRKLLERRDWRPSAP